MKVSICLLIVVFVGVSVNAFTVPNTVAYTKQSSVFLAKTISQVFINRLKEDMQSRPLSKDTKATLLPIIDDPASLEPVNIPLDITIPDLLTITGYLNLTETAEVTGLSKLVEDLSIAALPLPVTITYNVDIPSVNIVGKYDMNLNVDLGSIHVIQGFEDFSASVNNVFLIINAKLKIPIGNNPIGLGSLTVDMGFKNLTLYGDQAMVDGTSYIVDWDRVGDNLQTYFDTIWGTEESRLLIVEMIRCAVDDFINECTVAQLTSGELECLKDAINLECFGVDEPTTDNTSISPIVSSSTDANTGDTSPTDENTSNTSPSVSSTKLDETTKGGAMSTSSSSLTALMSVLIVKYLF